MVIKMQSPKSIITILRYQKYLWKVNAKSNVKDTNTCQNQNLKISRYYICHTFTRQVNKNLINLDRIITQMNGAYMVH